MANTNNYQIACRNLWKIFGPHPEQIQASLAAGRSKNEILAETGHVVAVKNVSFSVRKGETFVVMGLSGSGKSTLVRCLSRLIEATSGEVLLDGQDILRMDEKQLRHLRRHRMSMVFQHFGLFPHRPIIDNVAYGLEIQGVRKAERHARAKEVLKLVDLAGWEQHYPGELSGGMQQRVGIARALALDPEILLFDEPFSALDPLIRREMQDELISLQKMMNKTIVFITHDFLEAVKLGDDIAIMKDGEIVQIGTPAEVVMHPATDYVREFTKDVPRTRVLTARAIMQMPQVVILASESPQAAHTKMQNLDCEVACVNSESGEFLGLLSLAQISQAMQHSQQVQSLPFSQSPMVTPQTLLADLIKLVVVNNAPVPVVDESNRLVGAVDRTDVMLAMDGD